MRVRVPFLQLVIAAVVGGLVVAAFPAMAVIGGFVTLGGTNSAQGARTRIVSSANTSTLQVINQQDGTALDLRVEPGEPPLRVNRGRKVPKLNADRVDGMHAADFLGVNATAFNADKIDGLEASSLVRAVGAQDANPTVVGTTARLERSLEAPVDGLILMWGWASARVRDENARWTISCAVTLDGGTEGIITTAGIAGPFYSNGDCTPSAIVTVSAGTHTVGVRTGGVDAPEELVKLSFHALFVPFDGTGQRITVP